MPKVNSIREKRRGGASACDIAKSVGVSRNAVYKYVDEDGFSPKPKRDPGCEHARTDEPETTATEAALFPRTAGAPNESTSASRPTSTSAIAFE